MKEHQSLRRKTTTTVSRPQFGTKVAALPLLAAMSLSLVGGTARAMEGTDEMEQAAAAAPMIVIDDSRDGVQCPGALDIVDLWEKFPFPIANGQTLILCSGEYFGPLYIAGRSNITILGKADPLLGPPRIVSWKVPPSLGGVRPELIQVKDSTNVTIQGLSLDGAFRGSTTTNWNPAVTEVQGVHVTNSSVTITNNSISHIYPQTHPEGGTAILIDGNSTTAQPIRITNNTINGFRGAGIKVDSLTARYQPIITGNLISSATSLHSVEGIYLWGVQTGVVRGNVISGSWNAVEGENCSCGYGILVDATQHVNLQSNRISGMATGILGGSRFRDFPFGDNTIRGNTIDGAETGIRVLMTGITGEVLMRNNRISANKITGSFPVRNATGIEISDFAPSGVVSLSNNAISGNTVIGYGVGKSAISSFDTSPAHVAISGNKVIGFKNGVLP